MNTEQYRIKPGNKVDLNDYDPADTGQWDKASARAESAKLRPRLNALQEMLYATEKRALLVVLQGMDTSGKDGVIKHVVSAFNPQGCQIANFKTPTSHELAHDFLWRIHRQTPARGQVGIFNRSQYEDVLIVRVEELVPQKVWEKRYEAINEFEEILAESGVIILKFFLHLSPEEQAERLRDRLVNPQDQWKFKVGDLGARAKWDEYAKAYETALERCSTKHAPWYVVPADKKWYRNLVVSNVLLETLEELEMKWPPLEEAAEGIEIV